MSQSATTYARKKPATRWRIGLLFDSLWDDYEAKIWQGVVDEARAQDIDLLCFAGGSVNSGYATHVNRVVLHDLICADNVDGLLVISGCVGAYVERPVMAEYFKRFNVPLISIGVGFADWPSVVVDNRSGTHAIVSHFIEEHGCKRIAFIKGPETSVGSNERFAAYKDTLAENGLTFDPQLVVPGDFVPESGARAVIELVRERGAIFDAIVAANDNMAIGAMRALRKLGIRVPQDMLVGGFDGVREGAAQDPPLTTVRQPTYELGRQSVACMVNWLDGGLPPRAVALPTRLLIRGSCGCRHDVTSALDRTDILPVYAKLDEFTVDAAHRLEQRFIMVSDVLSDHSWALRLIQRYVAEFHGDAGAFGSALQSFMRECESKPIEPSTWGEVLHYLFRMLNARLPVNGDTRDAAFLAVNQYAEKRQAAQWTEFQRQTEMVQYLEQPLSASFDLRTFGEMISDRLPLLNVNDVWLMMYQNGELNTKGACYPLLQFEQTPMGTCELQVFRASDAPRFAARELMPGGIPRTDKARLINVFPLSFERDQFGFAMFSIGNTNANLYEIINSHLTSVIKGVRLLEETKNYTEKLERDVVIRTSELRSANEMLQAANSLMSNKNLEIEKLNAELLQKSKLDGLTNLYNRRAAIDLLHTEFNRIRRSRERDATGGTHRALSVAMFDLDYFKRINDTYGHLTGDQVLMCIGDILREEGVLREEDIRGRYGGEEFIVIFPDTSAAAAELPVRRFAQRVREKIFRDQRGEPFSVTISAGISEFHDDDTDEERIVHRADQSLYYAKNHGRNRIVIFETLHSTETQKLSVTMKDH